MAIYYDNIKLFTNIRYLNLHTIFSWFLLGAGSIDNNNIIKNYFDLNGKLNYE